MADLAELGIKITYFDGNINKKLKEVEKQAKKTKKASDSLAKPPKGIEKGLRSWIQLQARMKELNRTFERNKLSATNLEPLTKELNKVRDAAYAMNKEGKLASGAYEDLGRASDNLKERIKEQSATLRDNGKSYRYADTAAEQHQKTLQDIQRKLHQDTASDYAKHDKLARQYHSSLKKQQEENILRLKQEQAVKSSIAGDKASETQRRKELDQLKSIIQRRYEARDSLDAQRKQYQDTASDYAKHDKLAQQHIATIRKQQDEYSRLGAAVEQVSRRIVQFGAFIAAAFIVTGIQRSITGAVRTIADFDQALYNLQAITTSTRAEAEAMGDTILRVARETKFSAAEVAKGMQLIGQAGFSASEAMQSIDAIAKLATGTMSDFGSVVDLTTTTIRAFHLQTINTGKVADIFASAINNSKLSIDKLQKAFNYVGAAGKQAGLTLEETTASLMVLANNGIRASTMGTGLRKMLLSLISPNIQLRSALSSVGMSISDISPQAVGMEKALENLTRIMWDNEKQAVDVGKAQEYFGTRAAQVAGILGEAVASGGAFSRAIEQTYDLGAATRMAELQQKGLIIQFKNLQDRARNVALALGDAGLSGVLKSIVGFLRAGASGTETFFKAFPAVPRITGIAVAVGTVTAAIAALQVVTVASSKYLKLFWLALTGPVGRVALAITGLIATFAHFHNRLEKQIELQRKNAVSIRKGIDAINDWRTALVLAYTESEKSYKNTVSRFIQESPKISNQIVQMANEMKLFGEEGVASIQGILTKTKSLEQANNLILDLFDNIKAKEAKKEIETIAGSIESLNKKMELSQTKELPSLVTKRGVSETQLKSINTEIREWNSQQKQLTLNSDEVQRELKIFAKSIVASAGDSVDAMWDWVDYIDKMDIDVAWKNLLGNLLEEHFNFNKKSSAEFDKSKAILQSLPDDIQKSIGAFSPLEFFDFAKVRKDIEEEANTVIEFFNDNKDKMMAKFDILPGDYDDFVTNLAKGVRDSKLREYLQGAEKDTESLADKLLKMQDRLFPDKAKLRELRKELHFLQSLTADQTLGYDTSGMIAKIKEAIAEIKSGKKATEDWKVVLKSLEASFFPDQTKLKEVNEQIRVLTKALNEVGSDPERIKAVLAQLENLKASLTGDEAKSYVDQLKELNFTVGSDTFSQEIQRQADVVKILSDMLADGTLSLREFRAEQERISESTGVFKQKKLLEDYVAAAGDASKNTEMVFNNAFNSMEDALVRFATTGKARFKDFANSVISDITRMLIRQSITVPLAEGIGNLDLFASGGVVGGGGISAHSNTVVSSPTVFPFASGIGLMGEAGPEAIMPLTRTRGGDLGVKTEGGSNVNVQIIDQRSGNSQPVETEESTGPDGRQILKVMIRDEFRKGIHDGSFDKTLKGNMGVSRQPIRR